MCNSVKPMELQQSWWPQYTALWIVAVTAALYSPILDCDETYNYWEPLHFVLHGTAMQTWEYASQYALRSYAYIMIHALPIALIPRSLQFIALRLSIATISTFAQGLFVKSAWKRLGAKVGLATYIFVMFSPGLFFARVSFLPQTFCMNMIFLASAFGLNAPKTDYAFVIVSLGVGALIAWPYIGIFAIPFGLQIILICKWRLVRPLIISIMTAVVCIGGSIAIDMKFYHKIVTPIWNIVVFNLVLPTGEGGADIFGVEPTSFYFKNLFLNWNIVSLLFYMLPIALIIHFMLVKFIFRIEPNLEYYFSRSFFSIGSFIWVLIFLSMEHKEERFLYPAYPGIALAASCCLSLIFDIPGAIKRFRNFIRMVWWSSLVVFVVLSVSRIYSQILNYSAPLTVFQNIQDLEGPVNVCIGKEWYRYPSSFLLPSPDSQLLFLEAGFGGILPKPYGNPWDFVTEMNDQNREETSRYSVIADCDYLVDLDLDDTLLNSLENAQVIQREPFLDSSLSPALTRAFYIPRYSDPFNKYADYTVVHFES